MSTRPLMLGLHRYLALLTTIPLMLLCLTGAALVFEGELDRALNRSYWHVAPQSQPLPWQAIIDFVRQAHPKEPVSGVRMPAAADVAAEMNLKGGLMVSVDPYTGKELGSRRREQIFMSKVHQFHTNLLIGKWGSRITGVSTLVMIVLLLTGLVLWWRRKSFAIKWSAPWRRINYDAHYSLGILGLLPWLIIATSGVVMTFEEVVRPAIYRLTSSLPVTPPTPHSAPAPGIKPITLDAALAAARNTLPGAQTTVIQLPANPGGVFFAFMRFPEDQTPAGRSRVAIDQFTGTPVWIENSRTAPLGTQILNKNRPIHTGDIFGWPTRLLASAACIVLGIQVISGLWMWWPARSKGK